MTVHDGPKSYVSRHDFQLRKKGGESVDSLLDFFQVIVVMCTSYIQQTYWLWTKDKLEVA